MFGSASMAFWRRLELKRTNERLHKEQMENGAGQTPYFRVVETAAHNIKLDEFETIFVFIHVKYKCSQCNSFEQL